MNGGNEEQLSFLSPLLVSRGTNTGAPLIWLPIIQTEQGPYGGRWVATGGPVTRSISKPDEVFRPLPAAETPPNLK